MERRGLPELPIDSAPDGPAARSAAQTPPFAALAETQRRTGQVQEAEHLAREGLAAQPASVAGRVALGLALLDQGRAEEARREFEGAVDRLVMEPAPAPGPAPAAGPPASPAWGQGAIRDDEIDLAFATAETDPDQMLDATTVAQQALRQADLDKPEALAADPASPFATPTMATLLERQGDPKSAEAIRAALAARGGPSFMPRAGGRQAPYIATLEHWLENLRRDRP